MSPTPRPRAVDIAFWLLVVGAVLLVVNGLMAATLNFDTARSVADSSVSDEKLQNYLTFQRGLGIFSVVIGAVLGFLAGKTRTGDPRFRRATIAFAVAVMVLVVAVAILFKIIHLLALVAVLPIVFGALSLTRPGVAAWFAEDPRPVDG
ncbi:hypothetical protein [Mycolicibacterium mengxianglii]|uniref:hypothetical protein n=1 Tax=Mycolicibacterium mengxianglii TaxID=2736649 RepID=UPI0018EEEE42|nr:hypothetical protein [Mycolicibacterium mengxianglii]